MFAVKNKLKFNVIYFDVLNLYFFFFGIFRYFKSILVYFGIFRY